MSGYYFVPKGKSVTELASPIIQSWHNLMYLFSQALGFNVVGMITYYMHLQPQGHPECLFGLESVRGLPSPFANAPDSPETPCRLNKPQPALIYMNI